eukprot:gb/GECH01002959.1/.p1 GENE.gb/GECH01002959.1/~~gb/GECH01002959.1/.p1  ORF type:complete len:172 (+),score=28.95 gb/GECH01002959.1/:1-516(+)
MLRYSPSPSSTPSLLRHPFSLINFPLQRFSSPSSASPPSVTLACPSSPDTRHAGAVLSSALCQGDIVCLHGDMGVGKTVFADGLVRQRISPPDQGTVYVTSPTFVLDNVYDNTKDGIPVHHMDLWRLQPHDPMLSRLDIDTTLANGTTIFSYYHCPVFIYINNLSTYRSSS